MDERAFYDFVMNPMAPEPPIALVIPCVEMILIGFPVLYLLSRRKDVTEERFLRKILFIAFSLRLALALLFASDKAFRLFHEDAHGYEYFGKMICHAWRFPYGNFPIPEENLPESGIGYMNFVAALMYLFGEYLLVPSAFNSLAGTVTVYLTFTLAKQMFHPVVARRAALLTAFFPSMVLWSSMALKDPLMLMLIMVFLNAAVALNRKFSWYTIFLLLGSVALVAFIRFYLVYFLLFAAGGGILLSRGGSRIDRTIFSFQRKLAVFLLFGGLLSMVGLTSSLSSKWGDWNLETLSAYRSSMAANANTGFAVNVDISTPERAIAWLPIGLTMLLLGPFPWHMTSMRALITLPEMLFWWSMMPSLLRGLRYSIVHNFALTTPLLIFAITLCSVYALAIGNFGALYRMRAQVMAFLFVLIAVGHYVKQCRLRGLNIRLLVAPDELA